MIWTCCLSFWVGFFVDMNWSQGGMKGYRQTHSWKWAGWFLDWTTLEKEDACYLFLLKFNEIRSDNTINLSFYLIFQLIPFTLNRSCPLVRFFQSSYLFFTPNTFLLAFARQNTRQPYFTWRLFRAQFPLNSDFFPNSWIFLFFNFCV